MLFLYRVLRYGLHSCCVLCVVVDAAGLLKTMAVLSDTVFFLRFGQLIFSYYTFFLAVFFRLRIYGFAYLCVLLFICNQTASVLLDTLCGIAGFLLYLHCYIFCLDACVLRLFLQCVWHLGRLLMFSFCCRGFLLSRLHRAPQVIPCLLYGHNSALFLCPI